MMKKSTFCMKINQLGNTTPDSIINTLWWQFTTHFGMRVNTEHYNLCWGDVVLKTDINNKEYLELVRERQTKTRTGADIKNTRTLNPKIYATQDGRCPVALYKLYKCLRPADMCKDNDKFYIQTMPSMTKVEYGLKTSYGVEQNHFYHAKNDKCGRHRKR
jgi:hypothetical protein